MQTSNAEIDPNKLDFWAHRLYDALKRSVSTRTNEAELREDAEVVIREAAEKVFGISSLDFTSERNSAATGPRRPYDKAYGGLVVEWEWRAGTPAKREHAAEQATTYLKNLREQVGNEKVFSAIVADGIEWGFLVDDDFDPQLDLFQRAPTTFAERYEWLPNSAASCKRFLELLASNRSRPVSGQVLATSFGPAGIHARTCITLLIEHIINRNPNDRTDTLFAEWRRVIDIVYGSVDGSSHIADTLRNDYNIGVPCGLSELLFAIHTYLSIISKLFAAEVIAQSIGERDARPTLWTAQADVEFSASIGRMDSGEILGKVAVTNLFDRDVFSWYVSVLPGNYALLTSLRGLINEIGSLALPRVIYGATASVDVFRDLYHDLLPREVRKALGEFLTPVWLAEHCLGQMEQSGAPITSGRVLDPTCGTGTFLIPILRRRIARLRVLGKVDGPTLNAMLNGVCGFDINPIAVTAARTNYVLALGDLASLGNITLPIWRADSVNVPDDPSQQTSALDPELIGCVYKELTTSLPYTFPVPVDLAKQQRLARLRSIIESAIEEEIDADAFSSFDRLMDRMINELGVDEPTLDPANVAKVCRVLFRRIRKLRNESRNGIWARIIENSFAPILAGKFDVIVGNPPWISWTRLPESWRHATERIWKKYGLWRIPREPGSARNSLASGDIATLVYAISAERFAAPDAFVGLLVPKALVTADPGARAFRKFHLKPDSQDIAAAAICNVNLRPIWFDDWSVVKPFSPDAANTPIFLISQCGAIARYPVNGKRWSRRRARGRITRRNVNLFLVGTEVRAEPVDGSKPLSAWSIRSQWSAMTLRGGSNKYSFGKGLDSRGANGVYFVELMGNHQGGAIIVANLPAAGRNPAVHRRPRSVDTRLVYPLLRGRDVNRWIAKPSGYIVAPYDQANLGELLTQSELSNYSGVADFLNQFKNILRKRSTPPTRNWNMQGDDWYRLDGPMEYMGAPFKVVVRELQDGPSAALVRVSYNNDLGRSASILVDHKLCFCSLSDEKEALYLVGMINCSLIQELIRSFGNSIAISPQTLARLPIPSFDEASHDMLVQAVSKVIDLAGRGLAFQQAEAEADVLALALLGASSAAVEQESLESIS